MDGLNEKWNADILIALVGKTIRKNRKKQSITQSQLAFEAGIPREQVGRIERGEVNTTLRTLNSIAKALDIQIIDLFKN